MQVTVKNVSSLERRVKIVVPADKVAQDVSARIAKAAKTIRMDGFRPVKCLCLWCKSALVIPFAKKPWAKLSVIVFTKP